MREARERIEFRTLDQSDVDAMGKKHKLFFKGQLGGLRANFSFCDLSGLDLSNTDFRDADFTGAVLAGADLSYGNFETASFFAADLRSANLHYASFSRADLRAACFRGARAGNASFVEADLREGAIAERGPMGKLLYLFHDTLDPQAPPLVLSCSALEELKGDGDPTMPADFCDTYLGSADFSEANLKGAAFFGADVTEADFTAADLTEANFVNAVTTGTIFLRAKKDDAILDSSMSQIKSLSSKATRELNKALKDHSRWARSQGKRGTVGVLPNTDMRSASSLAGAHLTALQAPGSIWCGLDLTGINLQGANLLNADFRGAIFKHADLRGVDFTGANLSGCRFEGADFSPLQIDNGRKLFARLKHSTVRYASFPGAKLIGVKARDADFSFVDFCSCVLEDVDFTGARLAGAMGEHRSFRHVRFDQGEGLKLAI